MKALCWYGKEDVRVETVEDPVIIAATDAIVKITSTAICGSDLHLYDGYVPTMEKGDVLGHEPMGEVVEVGSAVRNLRKGDRVVVPFTISRVAGASSPKVQDGLGDPEVIGWNCLVRYSRMVAKAA